MGEGPAVPAGPLAAYQAVWPERYLKWSWSRQMWEVRSVHPVTGVDSRAHLLFYYDAEMDEGESPPSVEELAVMIRSHDRRLRKFYRPFDSRWVEAQLLDSFVAERLGTRGFVDRILDHNRALWERRSKDQADTLADGWGEMRRWFPVLAHYHATGLWDPTLRVPLSPGGLTRSRSIA